MERLRNASVCLTQGEREREREFFFKANPLAFTEGLYEAQSLHVSALKLQIPPRFVDRMVVS